MFDVLIPICHHLVCVHTLGVLCVCVIEMEGGEGVLTFMGPALQLWLITDKIKKVV